MTHFESKRAASVALLIALGASAAGCVYAEKEDFGDAVQHMQVVQRAMPGARVAPQDGERVRAVLQTYRQDTGKPQEIRREINITVEGENAN